MRPVTRGKSEPRCEARRRLVVIRLCQQPARNSVWFTSARQQPHAVGKKPIQDRGVQGRRGTHIIDNLAPPVVLKPYLEVFFLLGKDSSPNMPVIKWPNCFCDNQTHCEHGNKEKREVAISDPTMSRDKSHQRQNPEEKKESGGDKPLAQALRGPLHHVLQ